MTGGFFRSIHYAIQIKIFCADGMFFVQHFFFHPFKQTTPIVGTHKNDREACDLSCLDQCDRLE